MTAPSEPGYGEHGEWDAIAVGWALSALEPHDEARFAVHLPTCARCTRTVSEALRSVADLAYAVPDEAPPPGLKQRILQATAAEPRTAGAPRTGTAEEAGSWPNSAVAPGPWSSPPGPQSAAPDPWSSPPGPWSDAPGPRSAPPGPRSAPPGPRSVPPGPRSASSGEDWFAPAAQADHAGPTGRLRPPEPPIAPDPPPPRVLPGRGRHAAPEAEEPVSPPPNVVPLQPRRRRWARVVAAAAAVALIAGLGIWNLRLRAEQNDLRQIVAQREAAISQLTADGPAQVAAVNALSAEGKPTTTRRATVVVVNGRAEVITETLAPRTGSETYWLWTLNCDVTNLKPITGFQVPQAGFSIRNVGSDPGLATTQCFALSAETISGTPTKPGTVVAVGQLK